MIEIGENWGKRRLTVAVGEASGAARLHWGRWLAASLAALLLVRLLLLGLNTTDLFFDEAQYWTWSLHPAFGYYSKPPLIAWLIGLATEVCGVSEFCIRLPSPLLHTATAVAIYAIGARLYDARVGFWSALVFATLPGVSVSAGIISTDVPLLLFWALALYGFIALIDDSRPWPAVLLGISLGLGLNAKYAMALFVPCIAAYVAFVPERRWLLEDRRLYAALLIAAGLIAPNLIWNAANGFATFAHTADNAKWTGLPFHPLKALEFVAAQFGVFGPILFGALMAISVRAWRSTLPAEDRLLLAFILPVLAIVTVQAFISRAHANWAAVTYIAATVLVTATLIRNLAWGWMRASFLVHLALIVALGIGLVYAGKFQLPLAGDPFARTLGWKEIAGATRSVLEDARRRGAPFGSVVTDDRSLTAELLFYMRGEPTPVLAWRGGGRPKDHYELERPFAKGSPEPVLLVGLRPNADEIGRQFGRFELLDERQIAAGAGPARRVKFYRLAGFKGG